MNVLLPGCFSYPVFKKIVIQLGHFPSSSQICPLTEFRLPDETESSWIIRYVPAWTVSHACVNGGRIHLFDIRLKYFIMTPDLFRLFMSFSRLPAVKLKPDQSIHTVILIVWSSWTEYQLLKAYITVALQSNCLLFDTVTLCFQGLLCFIVCLFSVPTSQIQQLVSDLTLPLSLMQ